MVFNSGAQTALSPSTPALGVSPGSLLPGSPVLGLTPAQTNGAASTNLAIADVAAAVLNLQMAVEQSLPALAAFNSNFDFTSVPGTLTR